MPQELKKNPSESNLAPSDRVIPGVQIDPRSPSLTFPAPLDFSHAVAPRDALGEAFLPLGREFPNLFVLTPDVPGSTRAVKFQKAYPDRFLNSGVSEMNTIGMASGLSKEGWLPMVVGFAMFVGCKPWEQIRNSVAYPHLNVKIVATHGGINVGPDGVTAQAIEDIALMRVIPGMTVLAPTDGNQVLPVLRAALKMNGPVYIRLERAPIPLLTDPQRPFVIGESLTMREGRDATVIAIGGRVAAALQAAEQLALEHLSVRVISMVSIKPLDTAAVLRAARETGAIVVAEDHNRFGGVGSAVAEILAEHRLGPLEQVALADTFAESGETEELYVKYHLTSDDIAAAVRKVIARRNQLKAQR
jgi:transketolase